MQPPETDALARRRAVESIGRPLGDVRFLTSMEQLTAPKLRPGLLYGPGNRFCRVGEQS
jgi:hypothetical protein